MITYCTNIRPGESRKETFSALCRHLPVISELPAVERVLDAEGKLEQGLDPCELLLDPKIAAPKTRIAWALLKKPSGSVNSWK